MGRGRHNVKQRHTSFGGTRADQAADSPGKAKQTKPETLAAARMRRMREKKKGSPVTPLLRSVTQNVTNVTPSVTPIQAQPVTRNVTPSEVARLDGLIKSLTMRLDAMERWAETLEAKFPKIRIAASPLQGTSSSVPASAQPRIVRPGDMVQVNGRMVQVPRLDADGQPIPE